jgi:hypothetical protein
MRSLQRKWEQIQRPELFVMYAVANSIDLTLDSALNVEQNELVCAYVYALDNAERGQLIEF